VPVPVYVKAVSGQAMRNADLTSVLYRSLLPKRCPAYFSRAVTRSPRHPLRTALTRPLFLQRMTAPNAPGNVSPNTI